MVDFLLLIYKIGNREKNIGIYSTIYLSYSTFGFLFFFMKGINIVPDKNKADKREYDKKYRVKNKDRKKKQAKKYYQNNSERIKQKSKQWSKDNPNKRKIFQRRYRGNNPDKIKEYTKQYRKDNPDKIKEYSRKWRRKNPEKEKIYRKENQEKARIYQKQWRENNLEHNIEYNKQWRKDNIEKERKYKRKYRFMKRKTDLKFNLNDKISKAIRIALKGNKKGRKWENLVGYTIKDLIKRLKKTIPEEYYWKDFLEGKLHIDHIIPKSVFNFTKSEHIDFKNCWALSNLQLLPAKENLKKSNKLYKPFQLALKI